MTEVRIESRRAMLDERTEGMILPVTVEFRDGSDPNSGAGPDNFTMLGHAAAFNAMSHDIGGFKEIIKPGAFDNALRDPDVQLLWNHNANYPMADTRSGTLDLRADDTGLRIFAKIPKALTYAGDIRALFGAGIARGMSFAFTMPSDGSGEEWSKMSDGTPLRTLTNVDRLYDVSAVTRGAYEAPAFSMRSLLEAREKLDRTDSPSVTDDNDRDVDPSGRTPIERSESAGGDERVIRLAALRGQVALALHPERL